MNKIDTILNENEEILWQGKPNFKPYLLKILLPILWIVFVGIIYAIMIWIFTFSLDDTYFYFELIFIASSILGCLLVTFMILMIKSLIEYKNVHYACTNQRIIIQYGVFSFNYRVYEYSKIDTIVLKRGMVNTIFKTGNICITQEDAFQQRVNAYYLTFHQILFIDNPYEIFKMVKKINQDVRSDFYYPNNLRPEENSGYATKYKPKE